MRRLLLGAVLAACLPAPAAAQSNSDFSTKETRELTHDYARCVVASRAAKASEVILANLDNSAILRDYSSLIVRECLAREVMLPVRMRFGGDLYRYALADALVAREFADQPVPDLSAVPRLTHRDPGPAPSATLPNGKRVKKRDYETARHRHAAATAYAWLSRYGECVVRVDAASSLALLVTKPDSPAETAAFAALKPALARCLPEGETLKFGKVALRGSVAINYYRLAHAARGAQTKAGG